jgi:hypothetical protein
MKINKIALRGLAGVVLTAILFASCEKKTGYTVDLTTDDTSTQTIIAADELNVNNEFDQVVNESLLGTTISITTSGDIVSPSTGNILFTLISNAVIDTSQINSGIIKITYFGKNADNTKGRTGEVIIRHAVDSGNVIPWKTQGAKATITFNQYEVTVLKTNKSLWMNGECVVTNVSGGLLKKANDLTLLPGDSLTDKLSAKITFTYNDNVAVIQTWTWNLNQHRIFNLNDTTINVAIQGDTLADITTIGINRFDENFNTGITTPIVQIISGSFLLTEPLSGVKVINGIKEPILIIYGVSEQGNIVSNGIPFGYKIIWTNSGGERKQTVIGY